jgi:benzoyl-CoA reductase/2-hydroxyglutaryl-CoA dehydratase subunit BcrC/BadD/HgdB
LTPEEFGKLTPDDFIKLCKGYNERRRTWAGFVALLANINFYKEPLKLTDILPEAPTIKKVKTPEQARADLKELKERLREK